MMTSCHLSTHATQKAQNDLWRLVSEIQFLGNDIFTLGQRFPETIKSKDISYKRHSSPNSLSASLSDALYSTYYCQQNQGLIIQGEDDDLLSDLQKANCSKGTGSSDWAITAILSPSTFVVSKANATRHVTLNDIVSPPEEIRLGMTVLLRTYREDFISQPGFYYFLGDNIGSSSDDLFSTRIYLNINCTHAAQWVEGLTQNLNSYLIPFHAKILRFKSAYGRIDRCIIYISRIYLTQALDIISSLEKKISGLSPEVPMFTRPVSPGIAIADNPPNGDSFGLSRMSAVGDGIARAWHQDVREQTDILKSIESEFLYRNLDINRPWLNPGNIDFDLMPPKIYGTHDTVDYDKGTSSLLTAERIAKFLIRDAVWINSSCTWMDWSPTSTPTDTQHTTSMMGPSLYDGTAGIALLFAYLHQETQNPIYKSVSESAFNYAAAQVNNTTNMGFYSGLSGIIYTQSILAALGIIKQTPHDLIQLVDRIEDERLEAHDVDIISGRAGIILSLIAASKRAPEISEPLLTRANRLGQDLLHLAEQTEHGLSWKTQLKDRQSSLLGYSHGASGIALSLYRLWQELGDLQYKEAALRGIRFEVSHYNKTQKNWPDWREKVPASGATDEQYMCAWCHGAPGSALALSNFLDEDDKIREILDQSVTTICEDINRKTISNFCLCHGVSGNADILMQLSQKLNNKNLYEVASAALDAGIDKHSENLTWPTFAPDSGSRLSLMTGIAGVAYTYLRRHNPRIPSILDL